MFHLELKPMMSLIVCLVVATLLAAVQAVPGAPCGCFGDCDDGECCQILSSSLILSKRQANNTCLRYGSKGASCDPFIDHNGGCGCAGGLVCRFVSYTTVSPSPSPSHPSPSPSLPSPSPSHPFCFKRSIMKRGPSPFGAYQCD